MESFYAVRIWGVSNPFGDGPSFVSPIFKSDAVPSYLLQTLDEYGRISDFEILPLELETTLTKLERQGSNVIDIGGPAIYAFQRESGDIISGQRLHLAEQLKTLVTNGELNKHPFVLLDALEFTGSNDGWLAASATAYGVAKEVSNESAFKFLVNQILLPEARKVLGPNLKVIARVRPEAHAELRVESSTEGSGNGPSSELENSARILQGKVEEILDFIKPTGIVKVLGKATSTKFAEITRQLCENPRCVALVGPYLSGKTTLMEAMLHTSGNTGRRGVDGNSVGDQSPESRARQMSTELNVANAAFLGDQWTILDCPGSVELAYEAQSTMLAADVAVVVVEPEVERVLTISSLLRFLDQHKIPHMIFINKMDIANAQVRDVLAALQSVSQRPLVLRQVPLHGGESEITGYVDLVSARAYRYRPGQPSDLLPLPEGFWDEERDTRTGLIEKLADFDDVLLEKLLEEIEPSKEEIYQHLTRAMSRPSSCRCFSARRPQITVCAAYGKHCVMKHRRRRKPRHGSASRLRASHWRRSSRPITCRIPASCHWRGSGAGRSMKAWC